MLKIRPIKNMRNWARPFSSFFNIGFKQNVYFEIRTNFVSEFDESQQQ